MSVKISISPFSGVSDDLKAYIIRDSGTIYGLLSFDYELMADDYSKRYGKPYEIEWNKVAHEGAY